MLIFIMLLPFVPLVFQSRLPAFLYNRGACLKENILLLTPGTNNTTFSPGLTASFDSAGFFRLNCLVGDHLIVHEMQTFIEVTESTE